MKNNAQKGHCPLQKVNMQFVVHLCNLCNLQYTPIKSYENHRNALENANLGLPGSLCVVHPRIYTYKKNSKILKNKGVIAEKRF